MRRLPALVLLASALLGVTAPAAFAARLESLKLVEGDGGTRAVLELSSESEYKIFTLANPDRLVLDLSRTTLSAGYQAPSPNGIVAAVRTGKPAEGDLRVVLDLAGGVKPRSRVERVGGGTRLILELRSDGAAIVGAKPAPARTVQDVIGTGQRKLIIAIDAGHGGKDPGAIGPSGKHEKAITLAMARELAARIDADPGMQSFLVRDRDVFIPLDQRYMRARQAQADLFISIHADAAHNRAATGASVYVLSLRGASSEAARWLADQENAADLVGGVELDARDKNLAAVLLDLSQNATMRVSDDVASEVLASLKQVGKAHKPQIERANFVVLRSPDVPSMLVETGFISNPGEEAKLSDPAYRGRMVSAIVSGVRSYFADQAPPGTWYAARQGQFSGSRQHVVSRGETLSLIAARHGVPVSSIRSANRIEGDTVRIGDRLTIPVAATVASAPK
ncbi:MAG: N-acetylmuramoyl-L-alanine amidase [Arenimonas sp.]|uniref:N-acetylmuramoyl-L-alanine amidase n=1 Tax=Arenimonas sp. TaxID=1872635 RepID=UPI0025BECF29|nr:N-acetylmuramoyl-L-alanine amidase [Arenimonas sp.]MBW8369122.1 N-acetylmuramoyl-L-alanine amidase [Arenimonas sp.]